MSHAAATDPLRHDHRSILWTLLPADVTAGRDPPRWGDKAACRHFISEQPPEVGLEFSNVSEVDHFRVCGLWTFSSNVASCGNACEFCQRLYNAVRSRVT